MATTASIPAYLLPGVAVHQPPHLEGDASLATEILPGPPSSASMQQNALKRDPKKPSMAYSYLPPSDPGSTYSGLTAGTLIGQDPEGPRSKRSRIDKGATGRAQRASARSHGANAGPGPVPSTSDLPIEAEAMADLPLDSAAVDSDSGGPGVEREPSISRSSSSGNMLDPPPQPSDPTAAVRPRRKDKGKGKEVEDVPSRVKEEPKASLLNPQESPPSNLLNNEDHCSSCRSFGSLVYCDGCPRAFHLWCLDPPVESLDDDARWFCSTCKARKHPPRKPPASLFSPLLQQLQTSNPVEFSLPEDIRTFFKDVVSGPKGNYMDGSGVKAPRLNRHGQLEDRDPHRLRDRNGGPVLCFQCGSSALPNSLTANPPTAKRPRRSTSTAPAPDAWKGIVSCDYCNLHWHMDCVDPPLLTMPPLNKKWMCPNHAERVMPHKRRIPRQNASAIEITKPGQFNNGNIDVIQPELSTVVPHRHMPADEVLINGRRYRVPERVIVLDFWNKLNKYDEHLNMEPEMASGVSSPLTSLSSLDDDDRSLPSGAHSEVDELVAAQLLCSLSVPRRTERSDTRGSTAHLNGRASQPEKAVTSLTPKNKVGRPRKYPLAHKLATHAAARQGIASRSSESANTSSSVTISTSKRKRPSQQVAPESSSRELRSRSRTNHADIPLTATSSRETLMPEETTTKTRSFNVKTEEAELSPLSNPSSVANQATTASSIAKPVRAPRQPKPKDSDSSVKEPKEKRGKKRKSREDEAPSGTVRENGKASHADAPKTTKGAQTAESTRTPIRPSQLQASNQGTPPTSSVGPVNSPSTLATPSLKIRLPRLSNLTGKKTLSSAHIDTPTSLS